jgi:beta-aspartyl-dipeptidase (metallo-type)
LHLTATLQALLCVFFCWFSTKLGPCVAGLMTGKAGLVHLHMGNGKAGLSLVRQALKESDLPHRIFHPTHCNRRAALWEDALIFGKEGGFVDVSAFPAEFCTGTAIQAEVAVASWLAEGLPLERITMSSDGGGCLPKFSHCGDLESMGVGSAAILLVALRAMVGATHQVALADALATVTASPAALYRLRTKGTVEEGKDADLIVFGPGLEVIDVMAQGVWMVRAGKPCVRGPFERD